MSTSDLIAEFSECLFTISHSRAGWDYPQMPREQVERERLQEKAALARVRAIWDENPELHEELLGAFKAARPLVTMSEIARPAA